MSGFISWIRINGLKTGHILRKFDRIFEFDDTKEHGFGKTIIPTKHERWKYCKGFWSTDGDENGLYTYLCPIRSISAKPKQGSHAQGVSILHPQPNMWKSSSGNIYYLNFEEWQKNVLKPIKEKWKALIKNVLYSVAEMNLCKYKEKAWVQDENGEFGSQVKY